MNEPRDYHSKQNKPEKDKYHLSLMWTLKYDTNWTDLGNRHWNRHRKHTYSYQRGKGKWEEFGISRDKLPHVQYKIHKVLLYSTSNYTQYLVINHNGKEYAYLCVSESLCCTSENNIVNQLYFNKKYFIVLIFL